MTLKNWKSLVPVHLELSIVENEGEQILPFRESKRVFFLGRSSEQERLVGLLLPSTQDTLIKIFIFVEFNFVNMHYTFQLWKIRNKFLKIFALKCLNIFFFSVKKTMHVG